MAAGAGSLSCAEPPTELVHGAADRAIVPRSVSATRAGDAWSLTFHWSGAEVPESVAVTGTFTDWSPEGVPLRPGPGGWTGEVRVEPGIHRYKFRIDGRWEPDPLATDRVPDGFGGHDGVLRLGPVGVLDPTTSRAGDGRVEADAIGIARFGPTVVVRTLRGDVAAVALDGAPLRRGDPGRVRDVWTIDAPGGVLTVSDGRAPAVVGEVRAAEPADDGPAWARGAVWYQVFPDRFRNTDVGNDPPGTVAWNAAWASAEPVFPAIWMRFLGGDLPGVSAGLGHIAALGVDAVYLNPVWPAPSPHRYDATTWAEVDPALGGDGALYQLIDEVHARGMRLVLDGVFNHVGEGHFAAQNLAEYATWFDLAPDGRPRGWNGFPHLPALAHDDQGFRDPRLEAHILEVTRKWMDPDGDGDPSDGVDGWRLDVADEVPAAFWIRWRAEVARINPDAVVIGEVWKRPERWAGPVFHGVTDYGFAAAVLAYLERADAPALAEALADQRAEISPTAAQMSWTLLDSHDTDRLLSRLHNPGRPFDQRNRTQDDASFDGGRPAARAFALARLGALLQATLPGSPVVWQGDEVGVWGADDPHNRRPMPWPDRGPYAAPDPVWDDAHLAAYREIFALRRQLPELRTAELETVAAAGGLWVFRRGGVTVAVNASDLHVALPRIGGARVYGTAEDTLAPRSAAVWAGAGPL